MSMYAFEVPDLSIFTKQGFKVLSLKVVLFLATSVMAKSDVKKSNNLLSPQKSLFPQNVFNQSDKEDPSNLVQFCNPAQIDWGMADSGPAVL